MVTLNYEGRKPHNVVFGELVKQNPELAGVVVDEVSAKNPEKGKALRDMYLRLQR